MINLLVATRNTHKVIEIRDILGNQFQCLSLDDFPEAPPVHESGITFAQNAAKKAVELAAWLPIAASLQPLVARLNFVLADDSGLEVDALNGEPGVHSARFAAMDRAEGNSSDKDNLNKLLHLLKNVPIEKRNARFRCVLALTPAVPSSSGKLLTAKDFETQTKLFEGACEGRIAFAPRGKGGFGYDPVFIPAGYEQSFAELGDLGDTFKNQLSHRAKALGKLKQCLVGSPGNSPTRK
jgi:XTP/dITP diphosphohydrolase